MQGSSVCAWSSRLLAVGLPDGIGLYNVEFERCGTIAVRACALIFTPDEHSLIVACSRRAIIKTNMLGAIEWARSVPDMPLNAVTILRGARQFGMPSDDSLSLYSYADGSLFHAISLLGSPFIGGVFVDASNLLFCTTLARHVYNVDTRMSSAMALAANEVLTTCFSSSPQSISSDGQRMALQKWHDRPVTYNLEIATQDYQPLRFPDVVVVAYSPAKPHLLAMYLRGSYMAGISGTVAIYDTQNHAVIQSIDVSNRYATGTCLSFSLCGTRLLCITTNSEAIYHLASDWRPTILAMITAARRRRQRRIPSELWCFIMNEFNATPFITSFGI